MNIPEKSTLPPSRPPAQRTDAAVTKKIAAKPGHPSQRSTDDRNSYEAAVSEGWPVRHSRGLDDASA